MGAPKPFTIPKRRVKEALRRSKPTPARPAWKYRRLKGHKTRASRFLERIAKQHPGLFIH
jgi:hypothetical protein